MKNNPTIKYKRKLSAASIARMRAGGRKGSLADKIRAGRAGWKAMVKKASQ